MTNEVFLVHCGMFGSNTNNFFLYVPPLGISYIASYLREKGINKVKLIDLLLLNNWSQLIDMLMEEKPNIVGLSAMTSDIEIAFAAAEIVHKTLNNTIVVLGGPHATILPHDALLDQYIDIVVVGEGEITFLELIKALKENQDLSQIKGILYKKDKEIIENTPPTPIKNLDSLPFPARDIVNTEKLHKHAYGLFFPMPYPYLSLMATRGCYFNCSMCQPTLEMIFGKGVRYRSVSNVIGEIKVLKEKYGIKSIIFWDDTLTTNKGWMDKFCYQMLKEKINVAWWCYSRVNAVDKPMLLKMKKAGCIMICFGIESGSQRVLDEVLHKGTTVEQNKRAMSLCKEAGILINANVMFGTPSETLEEVKQTEKLLCESKPEIVWAAITSPIPGTELGKKAKNSGLILAKNWSEYIRGRSKGPKIKTVVSYEDILFYQGKWHRIGFKWQYLLEQQYIKACLIRCWCHIRAGYPLRIFREFIYPFIYPYCVQLKNIPLAKGIYSLLKNKLVNGKK